MHTAQLAREGKKNVIKGFHGTPGRRPLAVCSATKLTMGVLKCLSLLQHYSVATLLAFVNTT